MTLPRSLEVLRSETPVARFVPYSHHVTDTIISTRTGEYLSVWKIGGRSHQSASQDDVFTWTRELNNTLRGIGTANVSFWSHIVRRRVTEYPDATFDDAFCRRLDATYRARFTGANLMVNDLYLTVVFRPVADPVLSFLARHGRESIRQKTQRQQAAIEAFDDINRALGAAFRRYDAELLGTYDKNGHAFSRAVEFLALLVNGAHMPMPVCRDRIGETLAVARPFFSTWGEVGELRTIQGARRFGLLELREYGDTTEPGQLNVLLESPFEFVLAQSFSVLSRPAAKDYLQRHQRNLVDARDVAARQIEEIDEALDQLVSGAFVMGEHHATLTVFADTVGEVRDHIAHATSAFADVGVLAKPVDLALEAGFWAQLPANWRYRPRPAPITSLNFLSFSPFHNFMSGKPSGNPWGPAVTILKTVSGTPLYFNFHASKLDEDASEKRLLGNTMVIGQSSSGKTVLLGFLMSRAQKFGPTIVAFDKDRGMEIAIRAMGGRYLPLRIGEPTGLNPFALEPTPANLDHLRQLVRTLASAGGAALSHKDEAEIDAALAAVMGGIDPDARRLSLVMQFLPNPRSDDPRAPATVASRLARWCVGGEHGWLFDNATDALDLGIHRLYGFDVTEFLDNADIRAPLMTHLVHRTEAMIDGRRFIYVFDEFWKMLGDPQFEDLARNKMKTIRKENGIFVFATQEPGDALDSGIARTLVQQCATMIFLANPKASAADYIEGFKLTEAEFDLVRNLGEFSRRFLVKQGDGSAVAELDLSGCDDELLVLSGTPDNADLAEGIISEVGDDPDVWLPIFLARARDNRRTP